jgi:hypothetical protein
MKRTNSDHDLRQRKRAKSNVGPAEDLKETEVEVIKKIMRYEEGVRRRWQLMSDQDQHQVKDLLADRELGEADLKNMFKRTNNPFQSYAAVQNAAKASNQTAYKVSGSEDDKLVIMFMKIGSGDCILIKTPKGNVIVIDCGTRASPTEGRPNYRQEIKDMLGSSLFLNGEKQSLYALILTHPDADHYNELIKILKPKVSVIRHIFYSFALALYNEIPMDKILDLGTFKNQVSIDWTQTDVYSEQPTPIKQQRYDMSNLNRIQILGSAAARGPSGEAFDGWNEPNCDIYLLAGGLPDEVPSGAASSAAETNREFYRGKLRKRTGASENNSGSIVTLIQAHGRKVLLCGDATYATEAFLTEKHPTRINNVDLAQMEHHGSGTAHAGNTYVDAINPVLAVASAGTHGGDFNPRWRALRKYLGGSSNRSKRLGLTALRLRTDMDEHDLLYGVPGTKMGDKASWEGDWMTEQKKPPKPSYKQHGIYSTHSSRDLCFVIDADGNLFRKFSKEKEDGTYTVSYKIAPNGTLEVTETKD